jgi:prepilin-type N-terminal cleavage/methylation domain-containing protein
VKKNTNYSGFTLVELSMVLSIIAMIMAGITIASKMVSSTQAIGLIRDISYYKSSIDNFKSIYDEFPGDFPEAYALWGALSGANSCTNNEVVSVASGCNGNGDGDIDTGYTEDMRSWQHLQLSGFISGSYPGTAPSGNPVAGVNMPLGSLANSAYHLDSFTIYNSAGNGLRLINSGSFANGVVTPAIASYVDIKIDDGIAYQGAVYTSIGADYSLPSCVTKSGNTYNYTLSDNNTSCVMWFYLY